VAQLVKQSLIKVPQVAAGLLT